MCEVCARYVYVSVSRVCECQWLYLVQGLSMCSNNMLHNSIAVYKVGAHPRGVEDCVHTIQVRNAHNVVANVTLLVYLCVCVCVCVCACVCVRVRVHVCVKVAGK